MDPVPMTIAAAVATALISALLILWKKQERGDLASAARETDCNARGARMEAEVIATKAMIIDLYRVRASDAESRAEISALHATQMAETARVCARVLRRYEDTPIPDSSGETTRIQKVVK